MPKQKTNKAVKKRFKRTGRGKLMHWHSGRKHILQDKPRKRKRAMTRWDTLDNPPLMKKLDNLIHD